MDRHDEALALLKKGTVIPAIPLVLDENRKFDKQGQRLLINYYSDCGVGGIAAAVHTTQFEIRDPKYNLFEPVLETVSEEIERCENRRGNVIIKVAGVCGETEQAVKEAEIAHKYGFDAVLLSPGGLNGKSEEYMLERTRKVAEIMPVIGFYLQTACGGRQFTYNYWEEMCGIENVAAIKCASFNRYQTLEVVRAAALSPRCDEITLYTGNDDNIVVDLLTKYRFVKNGKTIEKGFDGGLLGHWSVWTKRAAELFEQIKKNDVSPGILTLAAEITDCNSAFFDTAHNFKGCIAGLHEILRRQGLMKNIFCLNPNETLSDGQNEELNRVLQMYPHLNDDDFVYSNLDKWKSLIK